MEISITLDDLYRDAEEPCRECYGIGLPECETCHGSGKVLTHIGVAFIGFLKRHLNSERDANVQR